MGPEVLRPMAAERIEQVHRFDARGGKGALDLEVLGLERVVVQSVEQREDHGDDPETILVRHPAHPWDAGPGLSPTLARKAAAQVADVTTRLACGEPPSRQEPPGGGDPAEPSELGRRTGQELLVRDRLRGRYRIVHEEGQHDYVGLQLPSVKMKIEAFVVQVVALDAGIQHLGARPEEPAQALRPRVLLANAFAERNGVSEAEDAPDPRRLLEGDLLAAEPELVDAVVHATAGPEVSPPVAPNVVDVRVGRTRPVDGDALRGFRERRDARGLHHSRRGRLGDEGAGGDLGDGDSECNPPEDEDDPRAGRGVVLRHFGGVNCRRRRRRMSSGCGWRLILPSPAAILGGHGNPRAAHRDRRARGAAGPAEHPVPGPPVLHLSAVDRGRLRRRVRRLRDDRLRGQGRPRAPRRRAHRRREPALAGGVRAGQGAAGRQGPGPQGPRVHGRSGQGLRRGVRATTPASVAISPSPSAASGIGGRCPRC